MRIENFKMVNKSAIVASFDVFFEDRGWGIREFAVMESQQGQRWLKHPNRTFKDMEGKTKYFNFTYFAEGRKQKFDETILELVKPLLQQYQKPDEEIETPF